jgi:hypothetical protein
MHFKGKRIELILSMETQDRPDFKKYTLAPVSRKYLLRIVLYLVLLALVALLAIYSRGTHKQAEPQDVQEIHNLEIEVPDSIH